MNGVSIGSVQIIHESVVGKISRVIYPLHLSPIWPQPLPWVFSVCRLIFPSIVSNYDERPLKLAVVIKAFIFLLANYDREAFDLLFQDFVVVGKIGFPRGS
jgi:hypothetical protein